MMKNFFYYKMSVTYMFRNKMRMILTIMGISLGLFIYILANVAINTYVDSLYNKANNFAKDSYMIEDYNVGFVEQLMSQEEYNISKYNFSVDAYRIFGEYQYGNLEVSHSISLIGLNEINEIKSVPYMYQNDVSLSKIKLCEGILFTEEDLNKGANKIIIEKSVAKMLFINEDPIGKTIDYMSPYGHKRVEICGVIEDMPYTKYKNLEFNSKLASGESDNYLNEIVAYVPYNFIVNFMKDNNYQVRYVSETSSENVKSYFDLITTNIENFAVAAKITSHNMLVEEAIKAEQTIRNLFNIIMVIICIVSGFVIMTIYCFSVKERTYEIGVRRALGASRFDILKQFVVEGIITAIISSFITIIICIIICNYATAYFLNNYYEEITLNLPYKLIGATVGISVLEGILFSILPAIMASKITPTEALRWD